MTVRIRLFAWLRDAAGAEECVLALPSGARGRDAKTALADRFRALRGRLEHVRLAVNCEYQPWDWALADGDELSLIPPVSGG